VFLLPVFLEVKNVGIYVNPGKDNFERAVHSQIYVDKTGLLEYTNSVLGTEQCHMCVSRPRRFGKSMAANMMIAYYSKGADAGNLFSGLHISNSADCAKHMNAHNVIYLDIAFELMQMSDRASVVASLQQHVINELREEYPGALGEEEPLLPMALAKINQKTGEKFIVIIDEWDAIFREEKLDKELQNKYVNFLRGMFKSGQSGAFIELAYLTGILPVKRYNSESALNNFEEFTMTDAGGLAEYVGFTESEVKTLCNEYNMDYEEARQWYDGYSFFELEHVYGPNSLVQAMRRHQYRSYWTDTAAYNSLTDLIAMNFDGLKDSILQMLAGERVPVDVGTFENDMTSFHNRDDVLTLLIHLGYLAYDKSRKGYIPNEEVKTSFYKAVRATNWTPVLEACKASDALLKATINGDCDAVAAGIDAVHMANTSILNYNDENALACVITLAYYNAINQYTLHREMPAGKGYADIIFHPRKYSDCPAMVVELKMNQSAESALSQIKERHYVKALSDYEGKVLLVGVNYDKETKGHTCVIEELIMK
jgi:hypothetical protein